MTPNNGLTEPEVELLTLVAKTLAFFPDEIRVERQVDDRGILLKLYSAPEDVGRLIGKEGSTAQALRHILKAIPRQSVNISLIVFNPLRPNI